MPERHADHDPAVPCRPAGRGLCEPLTPLQGDAFRKAWKAAQSARAKAQRNQRGRRPPPPITGVVKPPT